MSAGKEANNAFLGNSGFCSLGLIVDRIMDNQSHSHLDEDEGGGACGENKETKDIFRKCSIDDINSLLNINTLMSFATGLYNLLV